MPTITKEMLEKRAATVRLGGPGTVRRTVKAAHRSSVNDSKQIQGVLKKLGVTPMGETEEAFFYRSDGSAFHFVHPKVQTSVQMQCFVFSGNFETKTLADMGSGAKAE